MSEFSAEARPTTGLFSSENRQIKLLRGLWSAALDLLYPPRCGVCNRIDTHLCPRCTAIIAEYGEPIERDLPENLTASYATALHEGAVRSVVLALKEDHHESLVAALGERLLFTFNQLKWPISCIVPVPLHSSRLHERGYNQSALLAGYLGKKLAYPVYAEAIIRVRDTQHQVGLSGDERRMNVQKAFQANPTLIADHAVLLIDDVFTTGATLQACAEAVLKAGAAQAFGLTVTAADV